ncbi:MAG: carbohydrate ABC transporter substrate-binding protein [Synergistetes bacterium]|nr:carbohydrate ABC transporter substrate-binding protein [Synergistota bacterium]
MKKFAVIGLMVLLVFVVSAYAVSAPKIYFVSTQMHPAGEREFMVGTLLKSFAKESGINVEFLALTYNEMLSRVSAEEKTGKVTISVIGDLHGGLDVMASRNLLQEVKGIPLPNRTFISTLEKYSVIKGKKVYVPWMQATYVMVVNKEAYKYLPNGLTKEDVRKPTEKWTYEALLQWAKNMKEKTGTPKFGLPMAPKGLFHRFLHGYLLPSFTGYEAKEFDSPNGIKAWEYMRKLVNYIHPASSTWAAMSEPLLKGEVLLAWDHTARIKPAIVQQPDKFEVIPVPRGPAGRGYIVVAVGLAVPKKAPQKEAAYKLIDYLTRPSTQVLVLQHVGFFPTVKEATGKIPTGALRILARGVTAQSSSPDSVIAMIPNLGKYGGEFTNTYRKVFKKVVLQKASLQKEVSAAAKLLKSLFEKAGTPIQ